MSGEKALDKLLVHLSPEIVDGDYVFCSLQDAQYGDYSDLKPIAAFSELEGLTLIIPRYKADENGIGYESIYKQITLKVYSSLEAVGLTAAISSKLSQYGISANVVAGYYHDHIFVRSEVAEMAVDALDELAC
jgi:hypothetical protein